MEIKKRIAILGSTGSVGQQALKVISDNPDLFEVEVLSALSNKDLLIRQAIQYGPNAVVIGDASCYKEVADSLSSSEIKVFAGQEAISQIVQYDNIDIVLNAMVGYAGFLPTLNTIRAGKTLALANKESLVVGGAMVASMAAEYHAPIIPVDSEHSAIFQCMAGEQFNQVEKIILTASGGPFFGMSREELEGVNKEQALRHPNWSMGKKITIDSATMMNKGLEVIEARWLFGLQPQQIEVVIHPQSIIHSMVQFHDGSIKAQMGVPDMQLPIQYALGYPDRLKSVNKRYEFHNGGDLTFHSPDIENFRNLALAFQALERGGNACCVLNAANEVAVEAFLGDRIRFTDIPGVIESCLGKIGFLSEPGYNDLVSTDEETRAVALEIISAI